MAEKFILKNFAERCETDKFYRLDLIRGVSFDEAYDPSMPFQTLIVNFSLYADEYQSLDEIKKIPAKDIFKDQQIKWENWVDGDGNQKSRSVTLVIKVDVTNQFFLKAGTVWRNGSLVWEPSEFFNVYINQDEKSIVPVWVEKKEGTQIPFIYRGNNIQFLKFPYSRINGKAVTVLIPTTEVIRYYFSGSTYLTKELFNGALKDFKKRRMANKLFFKYDFNEFSKEVYIWLKRHCYDSDAMLIARALADDEATNAMSYVYASLVNAKKKARESKFISEACPRANLPFDGNTNLKVLGQWLKPQDDEWTFMVRTIEDCDHPLPFKKIRIESVDSTRPSEKINKSAEPKPTKPKRKSSAEDDGESNSPYLTEGEKPTNNIAPEELNFMMQRFSNLSDELIEKVQKVSEEERQRYYQEELESGSDDGSTLPGDYKKDNHLQGWNIGITDAEQIPISERLYEVSNAIAEIAKRRSDLFVQAIPSDSINFDQPFGLTEFYKPKGKPGNYSWNDIDGRNRRALFLQITKDGLRHVYALEIEGKGTVGYSLFVFGVSSGSKMNYLMSPKVLIYTIANKSGKAIAADILKDFESASIKHMSTDNDSFSERIERAVDGLLQNQISV
jgi:hypothetical protein